MTHNKALLLDLGNVLFEIDIPKCSQNIYDLLDPKIDRSTFRKEFQKKNEALETGELSKAVFINFILSQSKKDVQALDVILAWNSMLIGMPIVHFELLKRLKKKYNLYLLSNINAFHHGRFLEIIAEDHGITDFDAYFDQCFYSHLIEKRKPTLEAFNHVLEHIPHRASDVLYLDDTEGHLQAAQKLGINTRHVKQFEDIRGLLEAALI